MRLIDADELAKKFTNANASGINLVLDRYSVKCIEDAPTIEQPEIIRCRDCKLRDTEYCNMAHGFMGMKDDDYCSYAERREVSE